MCNSILFAIFYFNKERTNGKNVGHSNQFEQNAILMWNVSTEKFYE